MHLTTTQHHGRDLEARAPRKPAHPLDETALDLVGNTPLLHLQTISRRVAPVDVFAKAEWTNPSGSVKDRAARNMIREAELRGTLRPGMTILDATSGNTGIAYAWIGAARGYSVRLALPRSASLERQQILAAYGVDLVLTDPSEGTDGAIRVAREIYAETPSRYFYPDQYSNPANWQAHYQATGPEIWNQTKNRVTHFVAGLGTSGTFMGTGRFLKERNPGIQLVSFQPDSPLHGLEGMKHMESALVPPIYDSSLADENISVETEEAYEMIGLLAREEGLMVGVSAGAALAASLKVARALSHGTVVTVFPDSADRYLSEHFWSEIDTGRSTECSG